MRSAAPAASPANASAAASAGSWRTLVIFVVHLAEARSPGSLGATGTMTRVGTKWLPVASPCPSRVLTAIAMRSSSTGRPSRSW